MFTDLQLPIGNYARKRPADLLAGDVLMLRRGGNKMQIRCEPTADALWLLDPEEYAVQELSRHEIAGKPHLSLTGISYFLALGPPAEGISELIAGHLGADDEGGLLLHCKDSRQGGVFDMRWVNLQEWKVLLLDTHFSLGTTKPVFDRWKLWATHARVPTSQEPVLIASGPGLSPKPNG